MKTLVILEIDHERPIEHLANLIAGRAYTLPNVRDVQIMRTSKASETEDHGFALAESWE